MAYLNAADINVRGQNIGVLEGAKGRVQMQQQSDAMDKLNRDKMAQDQSQYNTTMRENRRIAAEAAAKAEEDRWLALGGSALGFVPGAAKIIA